MIRRLAAAIGSGLAVLAATGAHAQDRADAPAARADTLFFVAGGAPIMPFGGAVDVLTGEGSVPGKVVNGKPYSADSITESTQMLADGNRINHRNEARIYRDSQGRTRREQSVSSLGVWQTGGGPAFMVSIDDPVAGVSYFLDPVAHTARALQPFKISSSGPGEAADATTTVVAAPPLAPPPGGVFHFAVRRDAGDAGANVEFQAPPGLPGGPPLPGTVALRTLVPPADETVEDLGEQVLEGVLARGSRRTETIPAAAVGNERPIAIVTEQWYSQELEAVVLRRSSDPRFGETVYRLVNVTRSEPPPDLFTVPQGFAILKDAGPVVGLRTQGEAGARGAPGERGRRGVFVLPRDANGVVDH